MFKKLLKSLTSKKEEQQTHVISSVVDLNKGDIISFKERSELPPEIQGIDAEVTEVSCYEFRDSTEKELTLKNAVGNIFHLTLVSEDGSQYLSLSKPLTPSDIQSMFDEEKFSIIFDENEFASNLMLKAPPYESFAGWLSDNYQQTTKSKTGFYHSNSSTPTGRGEEFISHYCEAETSSFGLQVEIWEDGDTDIYAICECSEDVIKDLWPAST